MPTDAPTADVVQTFSVIGMTCHHCEVAVNTALSRLAGVRRVVVDVTAGTAMTESEQPLDRGEVAAALDDAGYELG